MFLADSLGQARYRMPRYYGTWLLTHAWADSTGGDHVMHAVRVARAGVAVDDSLLSAYALHRPDGRWSLLLVNRDPRHSRAIEVQVPAAADSKSSARPLDGPIDLWQYSGAQYQFREDGMRGHPVRDLPPVHHIVQRLVDRDVTGVFDYRDHRMVTLLFLLLSALAILPGIVGGKRVRPHLAAGGRHHGMFTAGTSAAGEPGHSAGGGRAQRLGRGDSATA